jgi:uncharacterized protein YceH (UPF0502 family)
MTDIEVSDIDGGGEAEEAVLPELSFEDVRVLGCLLEKEMTTPEHYPLTLNALVAACNQRSNRDPVVTLGPTVVDKAMEELRYKRLSIRVHQAGARGPKCKHTVDQYFPDLHRRHFALLAVLFLRGQQTLGELRQRTERAHAFADLESVQEALDEMVCYGPYALVKEYPPGGGRRVVSYGHLMGGGCGEEGEPAPVASPMAAADSGESDPLGEAPGWREALESGLDDLRQEVSDLKGELERLREELGGG